MKVVRDVATGLLSSTTASRSPRAPTKTCRTNEDVIEAYLGRPAEAK